jgi:hypothetical protein
MDHLGNIAVSLLSGPPNGPFEQPWRHGDMDGHKASDLFKGLPPCCFFHGYADAKKSAAAKGQTLSAEW